MKLSQPQIKALANRLAKQINDKIDQKNISEAEAAWELVKGDYEIAVMRYNQAVIDLDQMRKRTAPSYDLLKTICSFDVYGSPKGIVLESDLAIDANIRTIDEDMVKPRFIMKQPNSSMHVNPADLVEDITYRTIEYNDLDALCADIVKHFTP